MRKLFSILGILMLICMFIAPMTALASNSNFQGPGYYQKINGANAGEIKYFGKKGHPSDSSEWVLVTPDNPGDDPLCPGCGDSQTFFNGDASQFSGVSIEKGGLKFDKEDMYKSGSGTMGYAQEGASAEYYGHGNGQGLALAIGASLIISDKFDYDLLGFSGKGYYIAGATGNVSVAAVGNLFGGQPVGCAKIEGSGEMGTFAAKQSKAALAVAGSNGSFNYTGSTPNGVIIGGGITAGGAVVGAGSNNAFAASGQITASGIGDISCGGSCRPEIGPY